MFDPAKFAMQMIQNNPQVMNNPMAKQYLEIIQNGDSAKGQVSICLPVFNSCCDYDRVTVVNTGTTDIVISANPMLAISKMCG